eukprot:1840444-Amphidinium_carterae.2
MHVFAIETTHGTVEVPVSKPSQEPPFGVYKKHMSSLSKFLEKEAMELSDYNPRHDRLVKRMARDCQDSSDNRFVPIIWKQEYVEPPYANFYKDGSRWVWVDKNQQRLMKAEYRSMMMNKELIEPLTPDMPELMSVQPERRYHRFRMCKAHLISEDRFNEVTTNAKRQKEEEASIRAMKEQAEGKILQCTVEAVARLPDTTVRPQEEEDNEDEEEDDDDETGTVAEAEGIPAHNSPSVQSPTDARRI